MRKKLTAIFFCILALAAFTACKSTSASGSGQLPNPIVNYDTLADAAKVTGFELAAPDAVDGYDTRAIQVVADKMMQVTYAKGEDQLLIRKAAGTDDISGDYTAYAESNTVMVGSLSVLMKGEKGMVSVATWADGGYAFAVDAQDIPMTADAMSALVKEVQ